MSLHPRTQYAVPAETARVAKACFPQGHPSLRLYDELGTLFCDQGFADLLPARGQPAVTPGRLALVPLLQFAEHLPDRQAADAVRSRIDWKYLLGLELADPGFDHTILSEFRRRLVDHQATSRLFDLVLERLQALGVIHARGRQRSDATHVLGAIRAINRLELVGEAMRAALNALAVAAPERSATLQTVAFARDPFGTLQHHARRYGDPFMLRLFTGPIVLTGSPEGIQEIFTAPPQTFTSNNRLAESAPVTPVPRTFTLGPKGGVRMSYEGGLDG